MSNREPVGLRISLRLVAMVLVVSLGGCGSVGEDSGSSQSQASAASAYWQRDTNRPSVPTSLSAEAVSSAQVDLAWSASTDNRGVTGYRIRRNGVVLARLNNVTAFEDSDVSAATEYSYTVQAIDGSGNSSGQSDAAVVTTPAADTTPPTVSSSAPANTETGVALNSALNVTFSEAMLQATLNSDTFKLTTRAGLTVSGTVSATSTTATFTPSTNLSADTEYTATITTGVTDAAGNALAADFVVNFTTGPDPDTTPPTVSSTSPANAATDVVQTATVSATFSEAMTNSTLDTTSFTLVPSTGDGTTAVSGTVMVNGKTATFTPTSSLSERTQYTATISTTAKDLAGNPLASSFAWSFTTTSLPDTTPPTVSAASPENGASAVSVDSSVSATFSEPMDNASLTTASFTLVRTSGAEAVAGTVSVSGNTATFQPSAPLEANIQYTATLTTEVTDAAGNPLATNFTWGFTTIAATNGPTLAWDAVTAENLAGYRIYYGTAPGMYLQSIGQGLNVGNVLTYTIAGLSSGTRYYFAATAYDTMGNESSLSNEVSKDVP